MKLQEELILPCGAKLLSHTVRGSATMSIKMNFYERLERNPLLIKMDDYRFRWSGVVQRSDPTLLHITDTNQRLKDGFCTPMTASSKPYFLHDKYAVVDL